VRKINSEHVLLPAGLVGGLGAILLGATTESDFIRELGAFFLLFCIFIFPTVSRRGAEAHG
jgi:hypothetical protein